MKQAARIAVALGGLLAFSSSSAAEESNKTPDIKGCSPTSTIAPPTTSKEPERESEKEFVVDGTGVARLIDTKDSDIKNGLLPTDQMQDKRNIDVTFFDASATQVKKCGPSPLPAEQVIALVEESAARHQVDAVFAKAIAQAESDFGRVRDSSAGARGEMQLIPATAARFGVRDICDPRDNIEGGVKYLRALFDEFANPVLVAAAYNSGEGRIYEYSGVPPFPETVRYVARVINISLGVELPSKRKPKAPSPLQARATSPAETKPVAEAVQGGRFVDGVWNF